MHLGIRLRVRIVRRIRYQLLLDTHRENGSALQARVVIGRRGVRGPGGGLSGAAERAYFRNVDVSPDDPAIRGLVPDWQPLFAS